MCSTTNSGSILTVSCQHVVIAAVWQHYAWPARQHHHQNHQCHTCIFSSHEQQQLLFWTLKPTSVASSSRTFQRILIRRFWLTSGGMLVWDILLKCCVCKCVAVKLQAVHEFLPGDHWSHTQGHAACQQSHTYCKSAGQGTCQSAFLASTDNTLQTN